VKKYPWAASIEAWPSQLRTGPTRLGLSAHRTEIGDSFPLFIAGVLQAKSDRSVVDRRTWSCQRGSMVQGELIGGGWAEGGSPRRAVDSGELSGGGSSTVAQTNGHRWQSSGCRGNGVRRGSWQSS
jgi:hypothetical protein